jgi:hypothetical protein
MSLGVIATVTVTPSKNKQPCGPSRYHSNDDLCAQWKAADSASDATYWAMLQLWLSGLGVVGLGITLWFNFRALKSAGEANKISSDVGEAQVRGYLGFEVTGWGGQFNGATEPLSVQISLKNWGSSPCKGVIVKRAIRLLPRDLESNPIGVDCAEFEQKNTVWPSQLLPAGSVVADKIYTCAEIFDALSDAGEKRIYLIMVAEYSDFGGKKRETSYVAFIHPKSVAYSNGEVTTWIWVIYHKYNEMT